MCGWPVGLFFHCVSVLWVLTSKCEQIMVKTWPCCLWQWSMQAHACLPCTCIQQHLFYFGCGRFWKRQKVRLEETQKNTFLTHTRLRMHSDSDVVTRVFPSIFTIVMRIHTCVPYFLRKHIRNPHIFHRHEFADGNTFLIHSCFQFLFRRLFGKHIRIYEVSTYIWGTHARIYAFCA